MSTTAYNSFFLRNKRKDRRTKCILTSYFICRGKLAQSGSGNVHDALSLFKEVEEHGYLGVDRLKLMKELLKSVKEWSLFGKNLKIR